MSNKILVLLIFAGVTLFSCTNSGDKDRSVNESAENAVLQQKDGTISLEVDQADMYHDMANPESNTAEWKVMVSKSGRYDVWLSSATTDTTSLQYDHSVMLSIMDDRIEAKPTIDKVIQKSTDVSYPYFRAESFMGSLYIQEAGLYNIQVISDKLIPRNAESKLALDQATKLLSISLTPTN